MVRVGFIQRMTVFVLLVTCLADSKSTGLAVTAIALLVLLLNFSNSIYTYVSSIYYVIVW